MKKGLVYIVLIFVGIVLAYSIFFRSRFLTQQSNFSKDYFVVEDNLEKRKMEFAKSAAKMLGESVIINGIVQEAYKNNKNEVVLYIQDENIPLSINCTLTNSEMQVKSPFKLGETINIQGIFTQLNEQMFLKGCRLIYREPIKR